MVTPDAYGDELPSGSRLCGGQYTIERYLNSGGFGVTYLAHDSLGRRVVIKECFPSAMCCRTNTQVRLRSRGSDAEFDAILELFEKEARALAALQHPYIVGVHQYFRDNGTAYMAMDYIEGRNLLEIIETEPDRFDPDEVKRLLIQLLQAVGYIHANDILHRDISPDNILIDNDNLPVLIDFGAARESATRVSRVLSKVLTVKDGYSPQEFYLQGSDQVYSSDLYALAATFYHVVRRAAPPSSHTRLAAAARDMADPLAPLDDVPGYDAHFIDAINTCLSVFPKDRLPSAEAWRDRIDLERRKQAALERAESDHGLERLIADLVAQFHRDFTARKSDTRPAPTPKSAAPAPAPAPRPVQAEDLPEEDYAFDGVYKITLDVDADAVKPAPRALPRRALPLPDLAEPQTTAATDQVRPRRPQSQSRSERPNPLPPVTSGWLGRLGLALGPGLFGSTGRAPRPGPSARQDTPGDAGYDQT